MRHDVLAAADLGGLLGRLGRSGAGGVAVGVAAVVASGELGPEVGHGVVEDRHEDAEVDLGAVEAHLVRAGEEGAGDDVEEPEALLFGLDEEEQEPGDEVEALAVSDLGIVNRKGVQYSAER